MVLNEGGFLDKQKKILGTPSTKRGKEGSRRSDLLLKKLGKRLLEG